MAEIYSRAKRVIAWLGVSSDDCTNNMDILLELVEAMTTSGIAKTVFHNTKLFCNKREDRVRLLTSIFHTPYWSRIWVVQEFLLAKSLILAYDKRFIDWDLFNRFHPMLRVYFDDPVVSFIGPSRAYLLERLRI
jgi:hypothetical protein